MSDPYVLDVELALDRTGEGARPHMAYLTWPISIHVSAHAAVSPGIGADFFASRSLLTRTSVVSINKSICVIPKSRTLTSGTRACRERVTQRGRSRRESRVEHLGS